MQRWLLLKRCLPPQNPRQFLTAEVNFEGCKHDNLEKNYEYNKKINNALTYKKSLNAEKKCNTKKAFNVFIYQ